ncbi:hypothetical protein F5B20DRAFT_578826 [Whalleya microplaca]|nr:hypothetical protein F5B20DRAFT_578826 [Whalleya microplaca]
MASDATKLIVDTISDTISHKKKVLEEMIRKTGKEQMAFAVRDLVIETQRQHEERLRERLDAVKTHVEGRLNKLSQALAREEKELQKIKSGKDISPDGDLAAALLRSSRRVLAEYLDQIDPQSLSASSPQPSADNHEVLPAALSRAGSPILGSVKEDSEEDTMEDAIRPKHPEALTHRMVMALTPQKPARRGLKRKFVLIDDDDDDDDDNDDSTANDVRDGPSILPVPSAQESQRSQATVASSSGNFEEEIPSRLPRKLDPEISRRRSIGPISSSERGSPTPKVPTSTVPTPPIVDAMKCSQDALTSSQRPQRRTSRPPTYNERLYFKARGVPRD